MTPAFRQASLYSIKVDALNKEVVRDSLSYAQIAAGITPLILVMGKNGARQDMDKELLFEVCFS
jgi:hypothetical protein